MKDSLHDQKRSYICSSHLLVFRRAKKRWTQAELARAAGYTERLISKAESGRPIALQTIRNIAEALSFPDNPLHAEDLICNTLSTARQFVNKFYLHQENAADDLEQLLHDQIALVVSAEPSWIPLAGRHVGVVATKKVIVDLFKMFKDPEAISDEPNFHFFMNGSEVVAWSNLWLCPVDATQFGCCRISKLLSFSQGKLILVELRFEFKSGLSCGDQ